MKSKVLYLVALFTALTATFAGTAGATSDGYVFFTSNVETVPANSSTMPTNLGEGLFRVGCDGSGFKTMIAPGSFTSLSFPTMTTIGTTLYYVDNSTLRKIDNATAASGPFAPTTITPSGSPSLTSSRALVEQGGDLYAVATRYVGGAQTYVTSLQKITGLGSTPAVTTYDVTPAVSGWGNDGNVRKGAAFAGTTPQLFIKPSSVSSTTYGLEQTASYQAAMTLTATTSTGAPTNAYSGIVAGAGSNAYVEGDYGWMSRFNADTSTWTAQWGRKYQNPTGSNAGDPQYGTRRLYVTALAASAGGVYTVAGYGSGGGVLLAGYSADSGGFAYLADLDAALSQEMGSPHRFNYVNVMATQGTCTFDPDAVRPSIKSFDNAEKPVLSSPSPTVGTALSVTSPGSWTQGSGANTYQYQWQHATFPSGQTCSSSGLTYTDLSGATNASYTPTSADATNGCLRLKITGVNSSGVVGFPVYSESLYVMQGGSGGGGSGGGGSGYMNLARPTTTLSGCTLTISNGQWTPTPVVYSYNWWHVAAGTSPTSIGTSQSYTITAADAGKRIQGTISVSGPAGSSGASALTVMPSAECTGGGSSSAASTTSSAATTPTPGPALKIGSIPQEITLDITAPSGDSPTQEITAEVPCEAPEGQLLDRCTVNMTAPAAVMLGQGDGINVRADKVVSIGKATVNAKSGKKVIVVKVKINQRGRKALRINTKITATIGLTAITVSNQRSTGEATSEMRLPTQLISPQQGIFDANSTTLNKAGVAFVNRLAKLLPAKPREMVFIGFADNTGVPGDNRWLGDRRAKAVRDALEARGVEAAKSSVETKAARSPRDDNATERGRERNRRVSIRITY